MNHSVRVVPSSGLLSRKTEILSVLLSSSKLKQIFQKKKKKKKKRRFSNSFCIVHPFEGLN